MIRETFQQSRRPPLAWCAVVVTLCLATAPDSPAETSVPADPETGAGAVEGVVSLGPNLGGRRMRFNLYRDLRRHAPPARAASKDDEVRNVVVYLENVPVEAAPRDHVIEQRESAFVPHVLPVTVGSTVSFPNTDPMFHNVFSLSRARSFDLGRYPRGRSRSVTFDAPGIVKVFCHIHSDMSAVVMVLPNPFFAMPESDGRFRIEGIPAGEYRVVAWHERAGQVPGTVRVEAGRTAVLSFDIPLPEMTGDES